MKSRESQRSSNWATEGDMKSRESQRSSNWATEGDMKSRESQRSLRTYAPQRAYRRPRMHMCAYRQANERACAPEHVHANVWACGR
eukprot:5119362-Pleurochrysis_carterae.AAC.1